MNKIEGMLGEIQDETILLNKLSTIASSLMDDDLYTKDNAVSDLIEIMNFRIEHNIRLIREWKLYYN